MEVGSESPANLDRYGFARPGLRGQNSVRPGQYVGQRVRLADDVIDAGLCIIFFGDHFGETGRDDHRQVGPELLDPARDVQAAQLRQAEIANHQVKVSFV